MKRKKKNYPMLNRSAYFVRTYIIVALCKQKHLSINLFESMDRCK